MQHGIYLARDVDVIRDIVLVEGEIIVAHQVGDVFLCAGDEIVQSDNLVPFDKQAVA